MEIDALDGVQLQEGHERLFRLGCAVLPQRIAEAVPGRGEAHFIGVGVLDDQPLQPVRVAREDPKAHRPTVVLHEETEAGEVPLLQEGLHHFGDLVEGVGILRRIRHVAVAEAGIVHRDDVELVGQRRNEVAVLMRRGREAVQQNELGVAGLAGFAVEDVEPLDLAGSRPHRSLRGLGYVVHMTSLRLLSVMVGLLGEDCGRCGLSAGTTAHQLHLIPHSDFATFDHKTVEREFAVEAPVDVTGDVPCPGPVCRDRMRS